MWKTIPKHIENLKFRLRQSLGIEQIQTFNVFRYTYLLLFFLSIKLVALEPVAVYLTWTEHPESTMTIQWITYLNEVQDQVCFRKICDVCDTSTLGEHTVLPTAKKFLVHRVELKQLEAGTEYQFCICPHQKVYKFRTMPKSLEKPIRFVIGGDMYHDTLEILKQTNEQAAKKDPYFALIGGDIAYASGKYRISIENTNRWIEWLTAWSDQMITPDGYLIPMLPAIGNHDVNGRYDQTPAQAKSFYTLFAFPGKQGYNVLDFDNYLSILILDSGHTHPIGGAQTKWLSDTLQNRKHISNKFALYHVPAYPSARPLTTKNSPEIRQNWVPLFENYGLTAAFENHDHAYKRSPLIREGKSVEERGVLYLGDGGWGADKARIPKTSTEAWYIAKSAPSRNFILATLEPRGAVLFQAYDENGYLIDEYSLVR